MKLKLGLKRRSSKGKKKETNTELSLAFETPTTVSKKRNSTLVFFKKVILYVLQLIKS